MDLTTFGAVIDHREQHRDKNCTPCAATQTDIVRTSTACTNTIIRTAPYIRSRGSITFNGSLPAAAEVELCSASDASRINKGCSRTGTCLHQSHCEPSSLMSAIAQRRYEGAKTGDRGSTSTASTGRSSFDAMGTSRSSITSMASSHASSVNVTTVTPTTVDASIPAHKTYICPICNMGAGHTTRRYNNITRVSDTPGPKKDAQWDDMSAFKTHISEHHIDIFKRHNSSEYTCSYCKCAAVRGLPDCLGRFKDATSMVNHLGDFHARGPRQLAWFSHYCDPTNLWSYPPRLREEAMRLAKKYQTITT